MKNNNLNNKSNDDYRVRNERSINDIVESNKNQIKLKRSYSRHSKSPLNKLDMSVLKEADTFQYLETDLNVYDEDTSKNKFQILLKRNSSVKLNPQNSPLILKNKCILKDNFNSNAFLNKIKLTKNLNKSQLDNKKTKSQERIKLNFSQIIDEDKSIPISQNKIFKIKFGIRENSNNLNRKFKLFRHININQSYKNIEANKSSITLNKKKLNESNKKSYHSISKQNMTQEVLNDLKGKRNSSEVKKKNFTSENNLSNIVSNVNYSNENNSLKNNQNNCNISTQKNSDSKNSESNFSNKNSDCLQDFLKCEDKSTDLNNLLAFKKQSLFPLKCNLLSDTNNNNNENISELERSALSSANIKQIQEEGIEDIHFEFVKFIRKSRNIAKLQELKGMVKVGIEFNTVIEYDEIDFEEFIN